MNIINKDTKIYGSFSSNPGNNGCTFFNNKFQENNINAIYKSFYSDNIKKGFFLFNLFKDILDQFKLTSCSPVSVFLRINDWDKQEKLTFVKNKINREQLDIKYMENCLRLSCTSNRSRF